MINPYHLEFAKGLIVAQVPRWKAKVMLAQSLLESGHYGKQNPRSIFVQSGFTNSIGMMCPRNSKRYRANGGNVSGCFKSPYNGETWAMYENSFRCALDRVHWDKVMVNQKISNVNDYLDALMERHYWVENGRDAGYYELIKQKIRDNDKYNELTLQKAEELLNKKGNPMEESKYTNYLLYGIGAVAIYYLYNSIGKPKYRRPVRRYSKLRY